MRNNLVRHRAGVIVLLFLASLASAFLPPKRSRLPDLDQRMDQAQPGSFANQPSALQSLRSRLTGVEVEFDAVTGSPKFVSAGDRLLTSTKGTSSSLRAALGAFPTMEPHRVTKAFIQEHRELFGHGPEALDQARIVREFVTPHSGLKTVVWEQRVDDMPVFETRLISHTTKNDELVNISRQFMADPVSAAEQGVPNRQQRMASPSISARQAVAIAAGNVGEPMTELEVSPVAASINESTTPAEQRQVFSAAGLNGETTAKLIWLPLNRTELALCWDVQLTSRTRSEGFRILVDTEAGAVRVRR